jgi:predicted alpha/beta superfamily hydrolase
MTQFPAHAPSQNNRTKQTKKIMKSFLIVLVFCLVSYAASKQVTVKALYPRKVNSMYLRGDSCGLNWDKGVKMSLTTSATANSTADGFVYSASVNCNDATAKLEAKVLIDDSTWMIGSNHHVTVAKDQQIEEIYPWFYTSKGSLSIINRVYSAELKNYRDIIVYTPPSYLENTLKTHKNVLIMHDGQNLFDPRTSAFGTAWMCQDTLDSLIVQGKMDEVLIMGAYNTVDRNNEYTYVYDASEGFGGKGDLYLDWIESTLIPLTAKSFRVNIQRETLGILGSSLGGLISCYAGWTRGKVYGKVGCMSSSFWWDENDYQNNIIVNNGPAVPFPQFYMDSGTSGGDASCAVYTGQVYDYYIATYGYEANVNVWKYIDQGGSHNEASWGKRFYIPMESLYPPNTA